jgi:hypothetical protein
MGNDPKLKQSGQSTGHVKMTRRGAKVAFGHRS